MGRPTLSERILNGLAWLVALLCVAPIAAAALAALGGDLATWRGLAATVLPRYAGNTLLLVGLVAAGTAAIGTGAAWLITMYRFPGARILEVVLVLPLAFPAYVLAYAYTDFLRIPARCSRRCARPPAGVRATTGFRTSARCRARR